ncbi:PH domain-containing protein [Duncaniella freteri]|jgi:membrane protein YdbS with pleckstrin-like domain|uniref:PH domain-containing protein n=1 Tax=Duncaniella freteri TaxID=2530391 RepID=UPI002578DBF1|nr:PH domain-containing protein [Duncaniella freteri]
MKPPTATFGTIVLTPHWLQWLIDKAPWIAVNASGYCWHDLTPLPGLILALMMAMSLHLAYMLLYLKKMRFTITDEMMIYEHGVLWRQREYMELYRVIDFKEHIGFFQNLFGLKTVTVFSGDRSTPILPIPGIALEYPLVQAIRQRVEHNKRRKGIYEITNR